MAGTGNKDLDQALKGTEGEIFAEAFGADGTVDHEDNPDTSLEAMEDDDTSTVEAGDEAGDADADDDAGDETEDEAEAGDADAEKPGDKPDDKQPRDVKGKFADKDEKPSEKGEQREEKPRRGDPAIALRDERRAKDALKADLDKERSERATERDSFRAEFAKLEGRLDQITRGQQPPKADTQDKATTDPEPDIFTDPDKWKEWNKQERDRAISAVRDDFARERLESSLADAAEKQPEAFQVAYAALNKLNPQNVNDRAVVSAIRSARNPGAELMRWHKRSETLRRVGEDPDAFINSEVERVLAEKMKDPEFVKQFAPGNRAAARGEGTGEGGNVRHIFRNPRSVNSEVGRAQRANDEVDNDGSDKSIFDAAFA